MGAEIPDGAVLVARAITNSSLWTMRAADRILAITCICMANWKPKKWFDGETSTMIERGQFITSYEHLAEAARLSVRNVRTSLKNLEKVGFLTRKVTHRWTLVTLCKYDHYQKMSNYYDTETDTPLTQHRHATDKPLTNDRQTTDNKQEVNKGEERKEGEEGPRGAVRFLAQKWNTGPGVHLNGDKACEHIQAAIDVGVSAKDIDAAFSDHAAIKGKKIWEVLDPLRQQVSGGKSWDELLKGIDYSKREAK